VEIDREVEASYSQRSAERDVSGESLQAAAAWRDQDFIKMRIGGHDRRRMRLDDVGQLGVGKVSSEGANGGCREDDVADLT
jgi:hypothetical protein